MKTEWWALAEKNLDCQDRSDYEKICPRSPSFVSAKELPRLMFGFLNQVAMRGKYELLDTHEVEVTQDGDFMRFAVRFPQ